MKDLTIILFERLGILLVIAFVLTRTPGFKSLLYREFSWKMAVVHAVVFGLFGIASTVTGVIITGQGEITHAFVIFPVDDDKLIVSLSLVAIVIAGLLGGPVVGLGAGLIAGIHLMCLGGVGWIANGLVNPITGILAGMTASFFLMSGLFPLGRHCLLGYFHQFCRCNYFLLCIPMVMEW